MKGKEEEEAREEMEEEKGGQQKKPERALLKHPPFSKYDFIKIFIKLGEHSHLFSRLLLSRFLTSIQVPQRIAAKIALSLKKRLADQGVSELEQS